LNFTLSLHIFLAFLIHRYTAKLHSLPPMNILRIAAAVASPTLLPILPALRVWTLLEAAVELALKLQQLWLLLIRLLWRVMCRRRGCKWLCR
jgi:hypothetical protein